jgi:hypothetical protein
MTDADARPSTLRLESQAELDRLAERLDPPRNRRQAIQGLERLFHSGTAPDPWPSGLLVGKLVATTTWGPWDSFVSVVVRLWMPWMGKAFDPQKEVGLNRFQPTRTTSLWLRALFPTHPKRHLGDRIEAFPFRNRVGPGALDPDVLVMKIDYDFEANPKLIRHILDELVQIAPGRYLGKILFRVGSRYHRMGFFSLSDRAAGVGGPRPG